MGMKEGTETVYSLPLPNPLYVLETVLRAFNEDASLIWGVGRQSEVVRSADGLVEEGE